MSLLRLCSSGLCEYHELICAQFMPRTPACTGSGERWARNLSERSLLSGYLSLYILSNFLFGVNLGQPHCRQLGTYAGCEAYPQAFRSCSGNVRPSIAAASGYGRCSPGCCGALKFDSCGRTTIGRGAAYAGRTDSAVWRRRSRSNGQTIRSRTSGPAIGSRSSGPAHGRQLANIWLCGAACAGKPLSAAGVQRDAVGFLINWLTYKPSLHFNLPRLNKFSTCQVAWNEVKKYLLSGVQDKTF